MDMQQIEQLKQEAQQADDTQTVRDCETILAGNEDYATFQRIKAVIENAAAQQD